MLVAPAAFAQYWSMRALQFQDEDPARQSERRRLVVYSAASLKAHPEIEPVAPITAIKNRLRRTYDRASWQWLGEFVSEPYTYSISGYSNRGDEAIRVALENQLRQSLPPATRIDEVTWGNLAAAIRSGMIGSETVLMIAGGGYYRFMRNGDLHPLLIKDLELFAGLDCPLISFGAGVNFNIRPDQADRLVPTPAARSLLRRHLDQLSYCMVRDAFSQALLQECTSRTVASGADPVLFLEPRPTVAPPGSRLRVGLNTAFHGPNAASVLRQWLRALVDLIRSIRSRYDARFTYFVHCEAEYGIIRLLRDSGIDLEVVDLPAEALANAYAGVDVHICQMMHSSIMSARVGVPTLVVAYDRKHHSFFELIGQSRYCLSVEDATVTTLTSRFDELVASRAILQGEIVARVEQLRRAHQGQLRDVGKAIDAHLMCSAAV
ncbi:MAG: polysaccharide pyruvyl transferase family protein [Alphaproteobacteria bacterium]|nr:polysaccharide pyruvyl transferase family protein [Alphaproteobacteria bacterium]